MIRDQMSWLAEHIGIDPGKAEGWGDRTLEALLRVMALVVIDRVVASSTPHPASA